VSLEDGQNNSNEQSPDNQIRATTDFGSLFGNTQGAHTGGIELNSNFEAERTDGFDIFEFLAPNQEQPNGPEHPEEHRE
jgi:hypothetical protein